MNNIIPQDYSVTYKSRSVNKGHKPLVVWLTGLSGSGKSTIANLVEKELFEQGIHTYSLDGDNIRGGLNNNLRFSAEDRTENLRRIAEVARLFHDSGAVILCAFITPLETDRSLIKQILRKENMLQVYVKTSVEECERRDVKGLYKKARAGEIENFTGVNAPFEVPISADLIINTEIDSIHDAVQKVLCLVQPKISLKNNK